MRRNWEGEENIRPQGVLGTCRRQQSPDSSAASPRVLGSRTSRQTIQDFVPDLQVTASQASSTVHPSKLWWMLSCSVGYFVPFDPFYETALPHLQANSQSWAEPQKVVVATFMTKSFVLFLIPSLCLKTIKYQKMSDITIWCRMPKGLNLISISEPISMQHACCAKI